MKAAYTCNRQSKRVCDLFVRSKEKDKALLFFPSVYSEESDNCGDGGERWRVGGRVSGAGKNGEAENSRDSTSGLSAGVNS